MNSDQDSWALVCVMCGVICVCISPLSDVRGPLHSSLLSRQGGDVRHPDSLEETQVWVGPHGVVTLIT